MEKERKITAPDGCEIGKVEIVDGVAVVTFREKERKPPKSWKEFCEIFPIKAEREYYFNTDSQILNRFDEKCIRREDKDKNILPDRASAEAVLALCQLIQLRNCYNGDWVPNWTDGCKYIIGFTKRKISCNWEDTTATSFLYFKTKELRDEFLRYFRPLIEKLKPLYGIKEGGEE